MGCRTRELPQGCTLDGWKTLWILPCRNHETLTNKMPRVLRKRPGLPAANAGDAVSFNRLVLKWERPIYNLSLRMLRDADEAAEATQEVFLLAFKGIRRFRLTHSFRTWLYRIAANHCTSRLRKRPPGVHLSLDGSHGRDRGRTKSCGGRVS